MCHLNPIIILHEIYSLSKPNFCLILNFFKFILKINFHPDQGLASRTTETGKLFLEKSE